MMVYNIAAFTGAGMDYDYSKGDIDDHKDIFGRLFLTPFKNTEIEALSGVHFCVNGSYGRQTIPTRRFEIKGFGAAVRDDRFWTWETEKTGNGKIDGRSRWGGELHYIYRLLSFSSEYIVTQYDNIKIIAPDHAEIMDEDGAINSWSSWAGLFFTGEQKKVGNFGWKRPKPAKNFDPVNFTGPGSWEIIARYTHTETDENLFKMADYRGENYRILKGAHVVDEFTVGLNWGWNAMVQWQLNYIYLFSDDKYGGICTGNEDNPDGLKYVKSDDMIGLRMIFRF